MVTNVGIRLRGTGSRSATKPALRVDFYCYAAGRTFLGLSAISLRNNIQDPSGVRELLTMKMYRAMGLPAPRMAPAALYVNNGYFGLYNYGGNRRGLPRARVRREQRVPFSTGGRPTTTSGTSGRIYPSTNGYLLRTRDTESLSARYQPVEAMIRAINDASDGNFAAAVSPYTDLNVFMRLVAVQAAIAEADGLLGSWSVNNHFLYRLNGRTLHHFIPWDASSSLHALDYPLHVGHDENVHVMR